MLGLEVGTPSADRLHLEGILTHHQQSAVLRDVQRQDAVVLEKHGRLGGDFPRGGIVLRASETAVVCLRAHAGPEDGPQDAARLVIQALHRGASVLQAGQVRDTQVIEVVGIARARQPVGPRAHFDIQAVRHGLVVVAAAAPVGDDHAVEAPFAFQDVAEQALVVAVELAVEEVVGAHDGPGAAFGDRRLEGGKVDLIEGAVVHVHVGRGASCLLVVDGKVLYAGRHAVLLYASHIGDDHLGGQIRVLTHVFEGAAVEGGASHVDAGTQQDVLAAVAGLFADAPAEEQGVLPVPGGGERRKGGISGAGVIGPSGLAPLVPEDLGPYAVGAVRMPDLRDAQPGDTGRTELGLGVGHRHLFLQGHPGEGVLHPLFKRGGGVQVSGGVVLVGYGAGRQDQGRQQGQEFLHHNLREGSFPKDKKTRQFSQQFPSLLRKNTYLYLLNQNEETWVP